MARLVHAAPALSLGVYYAVLVAVVFGPLLIAIITTSRRVRVTALLVFAAATATLMANPMDD